MTAATHDADRAELLARLAQQQVFTPREAAIILGRSRSWAEARCADGTLPARRLGSRWLLTRADLVAGGWLSAS
jgi:excisionase family DNA binding protein